MHNYIICGCVHVTHCLLANLKTLDKHALHADKNEYILHTVGKYIMLYTLIIINTWRILNNFIVYAVYWVENSLPII